MGRVWVLPYRPARFRELAARLIGAPSAIQFKKGAICRIDFDVLPPKGLGQLQWFLPPRVLRKIA
jgi:hypothetical protein